MPCEAVAPVNPAAETLTTTDGRAKCLGHAYTRPVLAAFRGWISRLLAFCVFVLTLGRVQVNPTGRATVDGPGRDDTIISAKKSTR